MRAERFPFAGDERLRAGVTEALARVVDPEMALDIVSLGLVLGVEAGPDSVHVRLTMTSSACPVAEMIVDEARDELARALGTDRAIRVELAWDPPWTPDRMSAAARAAMGWDD